MFRESSEQLGSEPHQPEEKGQPTHKARDFESAGGSGDPREYGRYRHTRCSWLIRRRGCLQRTHQVEAANS